MPNGYQFTKPLRPPELMEQSNSLQKKLSGLKIDALIITNPSNIYYLTGFVGLNPTNFEREAILFCALKKSYLIVPRLYYLETQKLSSKNLIPVSYGSKNEFESALAKLLKKVKRVGFEEENLKYAEYNHFKKIQTNTILIPIKNAIEELRLFKSKEEIKKIEKAQIISQSAFSKLLPTIKTGQTELEIAHKLESIIKSLGCAETSFKTIVASGKNSAKPHHRTDSSKIKKNQVLLFDFGAKYQNYCADMTRSIFIGKPKDSQINIYNHVKKAQHIAISKIKQNIFAREVFHFANDYFKQNKLEEYFIHSLGHGIGVDVHESPHLSRSSKDKLKEDTVFSIEPGLYFPTWGGVRIEDLVTIKNSQVKILGKLQKEIIII